ncbi:MAG: S41 family peptidase [Spirochaetaceae bacterium]|jgi:carboxyl-terminal processing protease|nr:S41 family peptidase [Spirochaetaceae bacterium]
MSIFHIPKGLPKKPAFLWTIATCFFCLFIIAASGPQTDEQDAQREQNPRRYTAMIQNVFDFIQRHYVDEVDPQKIYEGAMSGMLGALGDPYSQFLSEKEMSDLSENVIKGAYGGVGLYISKPVGERIEGGKPAYVEVASPIEDTPGWRAGIMPGDLIIKIEDESTADITMEEVLARLKGPPGDQVNLTIQRGEKLVFPVSLVREIIEVPTVKSAMIDDIAYIRLISFSHMTGERTKEALEAFRKTNYKGLILDLRNNYGGLLTAAVDVCNFFLQSGVVVSVKSRIAGQNLVYYGGKEKPLIPENTPLVVLINHGSASASEIVAGALKDRGRAYLVGEKSYGKGSVQQVYPFDKSGFKITTARYYTPSDVNIDKIGIPPDMEVLFPKYSNEDVESLSKLLHSNKIKEFVKEHPVASVEQSNDFIRQIQAEYSLDSNLLSRLVRDEQNRASIAPVYDLEYDVQLQEAVKIIREGQYYQLIKQTKTLHDLQEEAEAEAQAS